MLDDPAVLAQAKDVDTGIFVIPGPDLALVTGAAQVSKSRPQLMPDRYHSHSTRRQRMIDPSPPVRDDGRP